MAQTMSFTIGAEASCSDGPAGTVRRVVVDPLARAVTHLVVEPRHRRGLGRLVPVELAEAAGDGVRLRCTVAEFERLDSAEETQFVPGTLGYEDYGPEQVLSWPYYGLHGLVVDAASRRVSHVLLAEGHLLGRKEVAIPISAVLDVRDGIKLQISRKEVADLPPVEIDR